MGKNTCVSHRGMFFLLFSLSPGVMGTIPCSTIPMWMLFLRVMNTEPWCHSGVEWNTAATFAVKLCWLQFWLVCLLSMTMYWINLVLLWISQYVVKVCLFIVFTLCHFFLPFSLFLPGVYCSVFWKCFSTFQLVSPFCWSSLGLYNFVKGFEGLVSRILRYVITKIYRFCKISRERAFLDFWWKKIQNCPWINLRSNTRVKQELLQCTCVMQTSIYSVIYIRLSIIFCIYLSMTGSFQVVLVFSPTSETRTYVPPLNKCLHKSYIVQLTGCKV